MLTGPCWWGGWGSDLDGLQAAQAIADRVDLAFGVALFLGGVLEGTEHLAETGIDLTELVAKILNLTNRGCCRSRLSFAIHRGT